MACKCDRDAIIAASVQLFHATMWTGSWVSGENGYKWTGERYEGSGGTAVYSYANGTISVQITYNLENKGTWEQVNGTA